MTAAHFALRGSGPHPRLTSGGWPFVAASILCMLSLAHAEAAAAANARRLVPAQFTPRTDAMGFRWDINQAGAVQHGTNYALNGGMQLQVNGNAFQCLQPLMTADGQELVLVGQAGPFQVTRRIRLLQKSGVLRYADLVENNTGSAQTVSITLHTRFNNQVQTMMTSEGRVASGPLASKETGVVAVQHTHHNRPSLLLCLCSRQAKARPALQNNGNYELRATFSVPIPSGQAAAVVHAAAQRRLGGGVAPGQLKTLFQPFGIRSLLKGVPAKVRLAAVNVRGGAFGEQMDASLQKILEDLGVSRGSADVLALGRDTRLHGTASCAALSLETKWGALSVPFERVAAVVGGKFTANRIRVFLRDGQVYTGAAPQGRFRFVTHAGLSLELAAADLDRLVLRKAPEDGRPPADVRAFVETFEGDRIAVSANPDLAFAFVTPWGQLEVGLEALAWLQNPPHGEPGCRVALKDGTRFFAYPGGKPLTMKTLCFGVQTFDPSSMRSIVTVGGTAEEEAQDALDAPHALLVGENRLVGSLDLETLRFVVGEEILPVVPGQIRRLLNLFEGEAPADGRPVRFEAEVWGGGTICGTLQHATLPLRVGETVFRVPVRDVIEIVVPSPHVPENLRNRIARLIRDLGHPDWQTRESASRKLAEIGYMARAQLREAHQQSADPEVRRRVQALLESLQ